MTLEQQVCSLELAKELKDLGVKQESLFWHVRISDTPDGRQDWLLRDTKWGTGAVEEYSAFTVAELGEMLPRYVKAKNGKNHEKEYRGENAYGQHIVSYHNRFELPLHDVFADTEADARAKMLIYLLKNKLITL